MKVRNIITATFAMIVSVTLSACAGSGNINNPRTSIYTGGQVGAGGQAVSAAPSLETDFQGNPCVKGPGIYESTSRAEIAKNPRFKLVTDDSFAGKTVIMEMGAKSGHPYNEIWVIPKGEGIWVDEKGIPAYRDGCANRLGQIQAPVVAPAPVPRGNVPQVYVDNHQENKTEFHVEFAPSLVLSTSGGGYVGNCEIPRRCEGYSQPVCRQPVYAAPVYNRQCEERVVCQPRQPVYCPPPVQVYCPPPNPAGAYNPRSAALGGRIYNASGVAVR